MLFSVKKHIVPFYFPSLMPVRLYPFVLLLLFAACEPRSFVSSDVWPEITPDYVAATIPSSMVKDDASLFSFEMSDGRKCRIQRTTCGDTVWVQVKAWQKGAKEGISYRPFPLYVCHDSIDDAVAYRLIEPGYESWHKMGIYLRSLTSYRERLLVSNTMNDHGCINCHTFYNGNPHHMLFHARGKDGGTWFVDGDEQIKVDFKSMELGKQGVYPAWHPHGRFVAFSSNDTQQCFMQEKGQPIEVFDLKSDIILYDRINNCVSTPEALNADTIWETFPTWSPDGRYLYYCAADSVDGLPFARGDVHYRLMALAFNPVEGTFDTKPDTVWQCDTLSASFPRISQDGRWLMFTVSSYGTFPIWHAESDLWLLDLEDGSCRCCEELNSPHTESYHSWSSNGQWVVFSSRRSDGRYTRLYFAHHDGHGHFCKPFALPQPSADSDQLRLQSYNIPEFVRSAQP